MPTGWRAANTQARPPAVSDGRLNCSLARAWLRRRESVQFQYSLGQPEASARCGRLQARETMLRVTKLTDYASVVLTVLASEPEAVLSATGLAERAGLEPPTVAKVLKPLAQAGLVEAFRGTHGGYRLARAPADISLFEIVEA